MSLNPICQYCNNKSKLVTSKVIYTDNRNSHKLFYLCNNCNAYVGCHKGTKIPLGILADSELRIFKGFAHRSFDKLWRNGDMSRKEAYKWLQRQLNIEAKDCHIGMFDINKCKRVIEITENYYNPFKDESNEKT